MFNSAFQGIHGHDLVKDVLARSVTRPAHAYVFAGPEGVGKRLLAERFAACLLGMDPALPLASHPDFIRVEREEEKTELTVKVARALLERMAMTSARGGRVVALIDDADRLNIEACNALLKGVEEPAPHAVYVFVTSVPEGLPATLRSRLVTVPCGRLTREEMRGFLVAHGASPEMLEEIIQASRGIPGLAMRWIQDAENERARHQEADATLEVLLRGTPGAVIEKMEGLTKACDAAEDPPAAWRRLLSALMASCARVATTDPAAAHAAAMGLLYAWRSVGTAVQPRALLEWNALSSYIAWEDTPHRFFHTPYL